MSPPVVNPCKMTPLPGGLFAVPGLKGAACRTGVKPSKDLDLALIVADRPMSAAGMFTTSEAAAAPVHVCRRVLENNEAVRSIVINSGNANALTGRRGHDDAIAMALATERRCGGPALVLSTGVIGVPLPTDDVLKGIAVAAEELSAQDDGKVARAILTTDTCTKTHAVKVDDGERTFTVGGIAKGSGMIHPNMATMLAVIATDAPLDSGALRAMLKRAVDRSFHEISVDGDTSTNDAVLLLSSREGAPLGEQGLACLEQAVTAVARRLAEKIIEDGEGRSRIMEIVVTGAASEDEARRVASAVACSSLVKTALAGGDPNWGRIVAAAGTAGIPIDFDEVSASLADRLVFRKGQPVDFDEKELAELFGRERVRVQLDLARGDHRGRMLTTDLTRRYVEINSEYTT